MVMLYGCAPGRDMLYLVSYSDELCFLPLESHAQSQPPCARSGM